MTTRPIKAQLLVKFLFVSSRAPATNARFLERRRALLAAPLPAKLKEVVQELRPPKKALPVTPIAEGSRERRNSVLFGKDSRKELSRLASGGSPQLTSGGSPQLGMSRQTSVTSLGRQDAAAAAAAAEDVDSPGSRRAPSKEASSTGKGGSRLATTKSGGPLPAARVSRGGDDGTNKAGTNNAVTAQPRPLTRSKPSSPQVAPNQSRSGGDSDDELGAFYRAIEAPSTGSSPRETGGRKSPVPQQQQQQHGDEEDDGAGMYRQVDVPEPEPKRSPGGGALRSSSSSTSAGSRKGASPRPAAANDGDEDDDGAGMYRQVDMPEPSRAVGVPSKRSAPSLSPGGPRSPRELVVASVDDDQQNDGVGLYKAMDLGGRSAAKRAPPRKPSSDDDLLSKGVAKSAPGPSRAVDAVPSKPSGRGAAMSPPPRRPPPLSRDEGEDGNDEDDDAAGAYRAVDAGAFVASKPAAVLASSPRKPLPVRGPERDLSNSDDRDNNSNNDDDNDDNDDGAGAYKMIDASALTGAAARKPSPPQLKLQPRKVNDDTGSVVEDRSRLELSEGVLDVDTRAMLEDAAVPPDCGYTAGRDSELDEEPRFRPFGSYKVNADLEAEMEEVVGTTLPVAFRGRAPSLMLRKNSLPKGAAQPAEQAGDGESDAKGAEWKDMDSFNSRFQAAVEMMHMQGAQSNTRRRELINSCLTVIRLAQDFATLASQYGKTIISEHALPESKQTIKPRKELGGVLGGQKYIVLGILFKFAGDEKVWPPLVGCGCGRAPTHVAQGLFRSLPDPLEAANKIAGLELKVWERLLPPSPATDAVWSRA